jgi:hypothetical protein
MQEKEWRRKTKYQETGKKSGKINTREVSRQKKAYYKNAHSLFVDIYTFICRTDPPTERQTTESRTTEH